MKSGGFFLLKIKKRILFLSIISILACLGPSSAKAGTVAVNEEFGKSVSILTYHSFLGSKNIYSFSFEELAEHCDGLAADGYAFIDWNDFKSGAYSGTKNVLVTIDDGHRTAYEAYEKVLKPRGIKPLLAVYPSVIGKKKFALTWEQLKAMLKEGCSVASHGFYHNYCNKTAIKKNYESVTTEILKSKQVLEKNLGCPIDTFAYPFGSYSKETISLVKQAGYIRAMTVSGGPAACADGYEIPRYILTRGRNSGVLALLSSKAGKKRTASVEKPKKTSENKISKKSKAASKGSGEKISGKPWKSKKAEENKADQRAYAEIFPIPEENPSAAIEPKAEAEEDNKAYRESYGNSFAHEASYPGSNEKNSGETMDKEKTENKKRVQPSPLRREILSLIQGIYGEKIKTAKRLKNGFIKWGAFKYREKKK